MERRIFFLKIIFTIFIASVLSFPDFSYSGEMVFYESCENLSSVSSNNGIMVGSDYSFVPGVVGNAIKLPNSHIEYPLPSDMTQGTVECWFRSYSPAGFPKGGFFGIGYLGDDPSSFGTWAGYNTSTNLWYANSELRNQATGMMQSLYYNFPGLPDSWHKLTFVWQSTGASPYMQCYLDGIPGAYRVIGGTFTPSLNHTKFFLGYCGWYGPANSIVDEFKIFNYPKTASEISQNELAPTISKSIPENSAVILDQGNIVPFSVAITNPTNQPLVINWFFNGANVGSGNVYNYIRFNGEQIDEIKVEASNTLGTVTKSWSIMQRGARTSPVVFNNTIYINDEKFLVKGVDYTPWLIGTGPDPRAGHLALPNEYTDVTSKVTNSGTTYVTDYSGNGKIEMWEVIQYDLITMKNVGANTIRIYSAGYWHDKNMNGAIDRSATPEIDEVAQGDLPDWVIDRILSFANTNNMKVIIGYWVQEEDFRDADPYVGGYQLQCDWNDLEVAERTFGRIVQKYGNDPAVLSWGIGNEVNGSFNHSWFTWTVGINDYLNALYAYVRSIDANDLPIMYAKYIGETVNFNNLSADIIGPQAYIYSPADANLLAEFNNQAPFGRAYMMPEFGHITGHISGHWDLAKKYSGGCFLEYCDVLWKGTADGQNNMGMVEEYRAIKTDRYNPLYNVYSQNNLPEINSYIPESIVVNENNEINFTFSATDPDIDDSLLIFSGVNLPSGATLVNHNDGTATFYWKPGFMAGRVSNYVITIVISDGVSQINKDVSVKVNNTLVFGTIYKEVSGQKVGLEGATVSIMDITRTNTLAFATTDTNGKFYLNSDSIADGNYVIKTSKESYNTYSGITLLRSTQSLPFSVTLYPPVLGSMPSSLSINENEKISLALSASDLNKDKLSFSGLNMPVGAVLVDNNNNTANLEWTPNSDQAGNYELGFKVTDGLFDTNTKINIEVKNVNTAPVLDDIPDQVVYEGQTLSIDLMASDMDTQDVLIYSVINCPVGASLDKNTGIFKWMLDINSSGMYNLTFKVSDGIGGEASKVASIKVINSSLYGKVLNRATKKPIPNSKIEIYKWNKIVAVATTGIDGRYFISSNLPTGLYLVKITAPNRHFGLEIVKIRLDNSLLLNFYIR